MKLVDLSRIGAQLPVDFVIPDFDFATIAGVLDVELFGFGQPLQPFYGEYAVSVVLAVSAVWYDSDCFFFQEILLVHLHARARDSSGPVDEGINIEEVEQQTTEFHTAVLQNANIIAAVADQVALHVKVLTFLLQVPFVEVLFCLFFHVAGAVKPARTQILMIEPNCSKERTKRQASVLYSSSFRRC